MLGRAQCGVVEPEVFEQRCGDRCVDRSVERFVMQAVAVVVLSVCLAACTAPGFFTDGSSVSVGTFTGGYLRHGRRLPERGEGYLVPPLWRDRGANFGTDELVGAIRRVARRVAKEYPGGTLGIADLSLLGGGDSELHRSHENGRDADLIYYAVDEDGRPVLPVDSMPRYNIELVAFPPRAQLHGVKFGPFSPRRFDVKRNWALIRALLSDPEVEVQYLFINRHLKERLLVHAASIGESPELLDRAVELLCQPGDSLPHDDHLHLRIYCATDDRAYGCVDRGLFRWWRKRFDQMPPLRELPPPDELQSMVANWLFPRVETIVETAE